MNWEQKYKEALERAKGFKTDSCKDVAEYIFPELKESEDERIRKAIIQHLKDDVEAFPYREEECSKEVEKVLEYIAWLEKQGEKTNPYSGISFEYNGHIWGMCAREGGVDILCDSQLIKHIEKQGEQKPADNVEPKFKVGDWIMKQYVSTPFKVVGIDDNTYTLKCVDETTYKESIEFVNRQYHLWTIQDAKDGDLISYDDGWTCIFKHINGIWYSSYCFITADGEFHMGYKGHAVDSKINGNANPATKEQCDFFFQKMKEEGYEWDAEKKELKKIEHSCYHNDGLYYAIDILEKTLGKVEGYQSDDGKMEHQIAIETVNALYHKKPAEWSEEDEEMIRRIRCYLNEFGNWLSDKNEEKSQSIYKACDWLKSLKPSHWKPSEFQLECLRRVIPHQDTEIDNELEYVLTELYDSLKKL